MDIKVKTALWPLGGVRGAPKIFLVPKTDSTMVILSTFKISKKSVKAFISYGHKGPKSLFKMRNMQHPPNKNSRIRLTNKIKV